MDKKKVIITGATSFIGNALIRKLVKLDYNIVAIIRKNSLRMTSILENDNISVVECNLEDINDYSGSECSGAEALFHVGWSSDFDNPRYNLEGQLRNVDYLENIMQFSNRISCEKVICIGSQAECGRVSTLIDENTNNNPETAYAVAKCRAYDLGMKYAIKYGSKFYWPRLLSAYGPNDKSRTMIMTCIDAAIHSKELKLTPCEQIWDYVYVDDVANALFCIMKKGIPGVKYPIASGQGKYLRDYVAAIAKITNNYKIIDSIGMKSYAENQVMYLVGNIDRLTRDTGFVPQMSFEEGVKEIIRNNFLS